MRIARPHRAGVRWKVPMRRQFSVPTYNPSSLLRRCDAKGDLAGASTKSHHKRRYLQPPALGRNSSSHCAAFITGWLSARAALTAYRYSVYFIIIRSFRDAPTEALFRDEIVRQFRGIARPAKRKLEALNAVSRLEDLMVPPANRLEKLKGKLKDFYSIRINDQWRVVFKWINREPHEVRILDYH